MADTKITALTAITTVDPANDVLPIVDVSDTSMAASGTTKKITTNQILGASGTATLASATITGDLTVDTNTLKVDSANNRVYIGTTAAVLSEKFNVSSSSADTYALMQQGSGITALFGANATGAYSGSYTNQPYLFLANNIEQYRISPLGVFTWTDGAGGTRMTLNSTGLGVGTSPSALLHVQKSQNSETTAIINNTNTGTSAGVRLDLQSNGSNYLTLQSYGQNYSGNAFGIAAAKLNVVSENSATAFSSGLAIGTTSSNPLYFATSNAVKMTLDASGNVGIGVTPSAWSTLVPALQLGGGGTFLAARSTNPEMYIGTNAHYNGANWIYKTSDAASKYSQDTGAHRWFTAPSGTAGNAITFTQAMTLDASGNLLVGVTSNPNTARAYFRYDTLTTQPVINSASVVAGSTSWSHFIGQSGNGSSITTSNIFIYGNGNIQNINGVYGTISDLRLKENIADARNYLADLLKLRVVKYSLKEEASAVANKLGFIAQEVEQVFPAMVDTDSEDTKSIKISVLIPMLVKAIQELTARVQTLETR